MKTQNLALKSMTVAAALACALGASSALAQPGPGRGWFGGGSGMMMGPWSMGGGHMRTLCSPRGAGFTEWRVARIERLVKPTDAQKPKLDDLKAASEKAAGAMAAACPSATPATPAARLEFMEKRTEAMLAAIKTVRPVFEAFYASLSDEQKANLDGRGRMNDGRGRFDPGRGR